MIDARSYVTAPVGRKPVGQVIGYAVHHSVTTMAPSATETQELAHIKTIDAYHVSIGYGGFGYHMAAFPSGRAYLAGDLTGQRAHVKDRNHELIGIVAIGDFSNALPGIPQLHAIRDCLEFAAAGYGELPVKGHNDWALPGQGTVCAGQLNRYPWGPILAPPLSKDGWHSEPPYQTLYNAGIPVLRIGGELPGQISKLFGDKYLWLVNRAGVAGWSSTPGD